MTQITSTLADLTAAQLTAFAQANMPIPPAIGNVPTPDPNNPLDTQQSQLLNLRAEVSRVYGLNGMNGDNQTILNTFSFACHNWQEGGKTADIPAFPIFKIVDPQAWLQWWFQLNTVYLNSSPNYQSVNFIQSMESNKFYIKPAQALPAVIIVGDAPPTPPPATDGPIGAPVPNNAGLFYSAGAPTDLYPDGYLYMGPTGVYQKHVYSPPFTAQPAPRRISSIFGGNPIIVWIKLG